RQDRPRGRERQDRTSTPHPGGRPCAGSESTADRFGGRCGPCVRFGRGGETGTLVGMKRARLVGELEVSDRHVPPWPGRAELVDGTAMYVRHTPSTAAGAEPALYVHGLGGSSQNWTDLAGLLAHRFDADAIDLPGLGRSEP